MVAIATRASHHDAEEKKLHIWMKETCRVIDNLSLTWIDIIECVQDK